jgi:hypothetical protein
VVRQGSAKALCVGSIPTSASNLSMPSRADSLKSHRVPEGILAKVKQTKVS